MAMTKPNPQDLDREELLKILAKKIGTKRKNVDFLFGAKETDEKSVRIPSFREKLKSDNKKE